MRRSSLVLISVGSLFGAAMIFLLLFWFAFPRWWPEMVIGYSPSLGHVLLADSYRAERLSGGLFVRSYPAEDVPDYSRFESRSGPDIYTTMAAHDDGPGGRKRYSIIRYLSRHLDQQNARIPLWTWRDAGDDRADWVLQQYTNSIKQGVEVRDTGLRYDKLDFPKKEELRPDKLRMDEWK